MVMPSLRSLTVPGLVKPRYHDPPPALPLVRVLRGRTRPRVRPLRHTALRMPGGRRPAVPVSGGLVALPARRVARAVRSSVQAPAPLRGLPAVVLASLSPGGRLPSAYLLGDMF